MDFNRSGQARANANTNQQAPVAAAPAPQKTHATIGDKLPDMHSSRIFRWSFIALLFSGTLLFVAMLLYIVFGVPTSRESKFVNKDEMQAVFVNVNGTNGGQVYFGKIQDLNPQFIRLTKVFYIQNQQTTQANSNSAYNLVKLGCELHGPEDVMVINRSQVFFWENLKNDSQVAQKAAEFFKQNPNGQKCTANNNSSSTQQSNGTTNEAPNANTQNNQTQTQTNNTNTQNTQNSQSTNNTKKQ